MNDKRLLPCSSQVRIEENFRRVMERLDALDSTSKKQGGADNAGNKSAGKAKATDTGSDSGG